MPCRVWLSSTSFSLFIVPANLSVSFSSHRLHNNGYIVPNTACILRKFLQGVKMRRMVPRIKSSHTLPCHKLIIIADKWKPIDIRQAYDEVKKKEGEEASTMFTSLQCRQSFTKAEKKNALMHASTVSFASTVSLVRNISLSLLLLKVTPRYHSRNEKICQVVIDNANFHNAAGHHPRSCSLSVSLERPVVCWLIWKNCDKCCLCRDLVCSNYLLLELRRHLFIVSELHDVRPAALSHGPQGANIIEHL
jgi:hypothetical protein